MFKNTGWGSWQAFLAMIGIGGNCCYTISMLRNALAGRTKHESDTQRGQGGSRRNGRAAMAGEFLFGRRTNKKEEQPLAKVEQKYNLGGCFFVELLAGLGQFGELF